MHIVLERLHFKFNERGNEIPKANDLTSGEAPFKEDKRITK